MLLTEATSETYCPRVYFPSYKFPIYFYFAIFTFNLYHKNTKNIILSSLSDLTFASGREGIDNPFIALVARFLFVCVGTRDLRVASYWIDTLVLKNWGKYLRYFAASSSPLRGNPTQCLRGSTKICRIVKTYDYINHVVITLPLSVYEGTWTHSPVSLLCIS